MIVTRPALGRACHKQRVVILRASNLSRVLVGGGRLLADPSFIVRACLASAVGHAVALITMALVGGGDGRNKTPGPPPLLIAAASDERPAPDLASLTQASPEEFDRLIQPATEELDETFGQTPVEGNRAIAQWLRRNLSSPYPLAGLRGAGDAAALKAAPRLVTEVDKKVADAGRNLGRTASFYGVQAEGRNFVFVVDISGSMSGSRFRRARTELCESIEKLQPDQSFYVILFNTGATPMPSVGMASADPASVQSVGNWLKTIHCGGETNPAPALMVALAMKPDAVYLLSDGKFDPAAAQTVSQFQVFQRIPVHTIGFASRKGEPMLRAISQVSGGTYRYVR